MYCNVPAIKYCVVLVALLFAEVCVTEGPCMMCIAWSRDQDMCYNMCYMIPNVSPLYVNVSIWVLRMMLC